MTESLLCKGLRYAGLGNYKVSNLEPGYIRKPYGSVSILVKMNRRGC